MVLKKLASQTAVYGLSTMIGRFLNFLLVPLYTATLSGTADYGEVSVVFSYASFLAVVFTFGLETGFFNYARHSDKPERVFSTATLWLMFSGLILVALGFLFDDSLISMAGYPGKPEVVRWFVVILAADAITSLGFAWLRFEEKPWVFAAIRLTNIFINIGANLFFLLWLPHLHDLGYFTWTYKFWNSDNLVASIFISNLIASVVTLVLFSRTWQHLKHGFDGELFRKMIRYSLPIVVIGLAGMVNETLDRILLKHILPPDIADSDAGIYSAFYKLSLILTLFVQAFRFAAEPFFFRHAGQHNDKETYAYIMKWFVYVCGFILVATLVFLPWLGPLLIRNEAYWRDNRGLMIVPVLLAANLFLGIYYNLSIWYKLSHKTLMGAWIAVAGAAITLAGNFLFIGKYSFIASAWTTLAAYGSMVVVSYLAGRKHYAIPYDLKKIIAVIIVSVVLGYWGRTLNDAGIAFSLLVLPAYVLMIWILESRLKKI